MDFSKFFSDYDGSGDVEPWLISTKNLLLRCGIKVDTEDGDTDACFIIKRHLKGPALNSVDMASTSFKTIADQLFATFGTKMSTSDYWQKISLMEKNDKRWIDLIFEARKIQTLSKIPENEIIEAIICKFDTSIAISFRSAKIDTFDKLISSVNANKLDNYPSPIPAPVNMVKNNNKFNFNKKKPFCPFHNTDAHDESDCRLKKKLIAQYSKKPLKDSFQNKPHHSRFQQKKIPFNKYQPNFKHVNNNVDASDDENKSDDSYVCIIDSIPKFLPKLCITGLNNFNVEALFDSGASVSIIKHSIIDKFTHSPLYKSNTSLKFADGKCCNDTFCCYSLSRTN